MYQPLTDTIKDISLDITKTVTENSFENNKLLESSNKKLLEIRNDRCITASYLLSPLSLITNPDHTSQFKLLKDPQSNRVNDPIINKTKPNTLNNNLLTFRRKFELQGDLLELITNKNDNVDLAKLWDTKLKLYFAKEMYFDERALGYKSTSD